MTMATRQKYFAKGIIQIYICFNECAPESKCMVYGGRVDSFLPQGTPWAFSSATHI